MKTVTITEFKEDPSKYLRFVQAGLPVLLLERNKPVAVLRPIEPKDETDADELRRMNGLGIARPLAQLR